MTGFSPAQALGLAGEQIALLQLQERGYSAHLVSDWLADVDIILENCAPVEVKLARATWQRAGRRRHGSALLARKRAQRGQPATRQQLDHPLRGVLRVP